MADPAASERDLDQIEQYLVSGTPDEPVFEAGEAGRGLYVIQEGRFELVAPVDGEEVTVAELGPGDFFGERALFDDAPSGLTARPLTDYKVVLLGRGTFEQVVAEDPAIGMSLMGWLAGQLREQRLELARALQPAAGEAGPAEAVEPGPTDPAAAEGAAAPEPGDAAGATPQGDAGASAAAAPGAAAGQAAEAQEPSTGPRLRHPDSGSEFDIPTDTDEMLVGRPDPDSGIAPDLDFGGLDEGRTLSRRHARIVRRDDGFYLEDLGAANGTFVNGERIPAESPVELQGGDEIRFGLVETVFELD